MTMTETAPVLMWGHCPKCDRWRGYETGSCPVCAEPLTQPVEGETKELARQFFPTLLAVQELEDDSVKAARQPQWWWNATNDDVRKMGRELEGLGISEGLIEPRRRVLAGGTPIEVITVTLDGVVWEATKQGGKLNLLRVIETAADAEPSAESQRLDQVALGALDAATTGKGKR